jgi:hypothetical protein
MNGKAEIETERDGLKRIVALLFSFAGLAERAAGRSYPVRCLVLWLLRRAEIIARDWIAEGSPDAMQPAAPVAVLHRNSRPRRCILAEPSARWPILRRELHLEERFARRLMRGKARRRTDSGPSGERDIPIRSLGATSSRAGQFLPLPCRRNPSKSRAFWRCRGSPSSARRSIGEYLLHPIALRRGLGFETTLRSARLVLDSICHARQSLQFNPPSYPPA